MILLIYTCIFVNTCIIFMDFFFDFLVSIFIYNFLDTSRACQNLFVEPPHRRSMCKMLFMFYKPQNSYTLL